MGENPYRSPKVHDPRRTMQLRSPTLVECLVVLAILAVIAALFVPVRHSAPRLRRHPPTTTKPALSAQVDVRSDDQHQLA